MKTLFGPLLGALGALPFAASATLVYVGYEGVVSSSNDAGYAVGDSFSGSLTIDTALAPPDFFPEYKHVGLYGSLDFCECRGNFVTGFQDMPGARASDQINVSRFVGGQPQFGRWGYDSVQIHDVQGNGTADVKHLELAVMHTGLLDNTGLVHSFEVSAPEGNQNLFGYLDQGWGAAKSRVIFAITKFSMTPTPGQFSCHL